MKKVAGGDICPPLLQEAGGKEGKTWMFQPSWESHREIKTELCSGGNLVWKAMHRVKGIKSVSGK